MKLENNWHPNKVSKIEKGKTFPERYPANVDSIGIEIVGKSYEVPGKKDNVYEKVNDKQNDSLKWLIAELVDTLKVSMT